MVAKISLRTHLITPEDDIKGVICQYAKNIAEPGDLIAICESVVAITQGRLFLPEKVKVGGLARFLCRFTSRHGSLTSPAAMQLAINEAGKLKVLLGAALGGVGRLVGCKGIFYRVAGPQVALIDDVAGTMPPFEGYIVLGPEKANQVAQDIRTETGVDTVIVDVNDLGCVDVIGASQGVDHRLVKELLEDNPSGNYDQQTPITLLKNYRNQ